MHLAQINVGRLLHPLDDPRTAGFVDNLDKVNAVAEASDGFLWRLKDETGNATQIAAYDDPLMIVNMSVWTSIEALYEFAYQTVHRRFVQRRKEWFGLYGRPYLALWWIDEGRLPAAWTDGSGSTTSTGLARPHMPSISARRSRQVLVNRGATCLLPTTACRSPTAPADSPCQMARAVVSYPLIFLRVGPTVMRAVHVVVTGRVQGVGYRAWAEDEALKRGLAGWVRNRRDGTVEAVFCGDDADVEAILFACGNGPRAAIVFDVVTGAYQGPPITRFMVLPTV